VAAARDDPRFPPVESDELQTLRIEISVLAEARALQPVVPEKVVVGRDGLLVRRGHSSGLLLPQVAAEYHWGPEELLAAVCRKAELAPEAWREPGTRVFTFQADVFSEPATKDGQGG
jgi:AmmeMemoRadiSam system protein A